MGGGLSFWCGVVIICQLYAMYYNIFSIYTIQCSYVVHTRHLLLEDLKRVTWSSCCIIIHMGGYPGSLKL